MRIQQYYIDKKQIIAEGSEGKLYKCIDIDNQQFQLCAKIVELGKDKIEKQLDILTKLKNNGNSKNLVNIKYFEYVEKLQSIIIIMEKCHYTLKLELEYRKQSNQGFSDQEIEDFLSQFLSGYYILYSHKILHRDIKPDNILINNENGKLIYKLTDFGISKVCDPNQLQMTQIGTPLYAPPEHYLENKLLNFKQQDDDFPQSKRDVYSLGIILYQMMTGELPFKQTKAKDFISRIKDTPFKMESKNHKKQLIQLIEQMIQYFPLKRISIPQLRQYVQNNSANLIPILDPNYQNRSTKIIEKNTQSNNFINGMVKSIKVQSNGSSQMNGQNKFNNWYNLNKNISFANQPQAQIINQLGCQTQRERFYTEYQSINIQPQNQINVCQTIKQYIQEFINNFEPQIKVEVINKLKQINLNQLTISQENAEKIQSIFQFEKSKIDDYSFQSLQFYYCLRNYKQLSIQSIQNKDTLKSFLQ